MCFGFSLGIVATLLIAFIFRDFILPRFINGMHIKVEDKDGNVSEIQTQELIKMQKDMSELLDNTIDTLLYSYNDYWAIKNLIDYIKKYYFNSPNAELSPDVIMPGFDEHIEERLKLLEKQFKRYGVTDYKNIKKDYKALNKTIKDKNQ